MPPRLYKGEAIRTYLYLTTTIPALWQQAGLRIFSPDEVNTSIASRARFKTTILASGRRARGQFIIDYLNNVQLLQQGKYETLNPWAAALCALHLPGIGLPQDCLFSILRWRLSSFVLSNYKTSDISSTTTGVVPDCLPAHNHCHHAAKRP